MAARYLWPRQATSASADPCGSVRRRGKFTRRGVMAYRSRASACTRFWTDMTGAISRTGTTAAYGTSSRTKAAAFAVSSTNRMLRRFAPHKNCWQKLAACRLNGPPSAQQIKDQNHDRNNEQQVDETSAHMKTETQQPQNSQNNDDRPKHVNLRQQYCGYML